MKYATFSHQFSKQNKIQEKIQVELFRDFARDIKKKELLGLLCYDYLSVSSHYLRKARKLSVETHCHN